MKTTLVLSVPSLKAQNVDLKGTWTMFQMVYIVGDNTQTMTEDMLNANKSFTDLFIMEGSKFKQTSNMSGSGTTDTFEGTWRIEGNKIIFSLLVNNQSTDVDYTWEMKEKSLILTRTSPDGSMKIVSSYKKKPA
jgi:hypothetical protein